MRKLTLAFLTLAILATACSEKPTDGIATAGQPQVMQSAPAAGQPTTNTTIVNAPAQNSGVDASSVLLGAAGGYMAGQLLNGSGSSSQLELERQRERTALAERERMDTQARLERLKQHSLMARPVQPVAAVPKAPAAVVPSYIPKPVTTVTPSYATKPSFSGPSSYSAPRTTFSSSTSFSSRSTTSSGRR